MTTVTPAAAQTSDAQPAAWTGFVAGPWQDQIDVRDFIQRNYTPYTGDASFLAGDNVNGPFSAYAQAQIINEHALDASGGKTYAELDREDPVRAVVMNGSFLRASLFTSVLAFGVSAMAMGLGLVQVLGGVALHKLGRQADL